LGPDCVRPVWALALRNSKFVLFIYADCSWKPGRMLLCKELSFNGG
jgi:hypothetical protein